MKPNEFANAPTPPAADFRPRQDETKKLSFWVSQIFILLATIIGVYLASSQGFKQALAYGEVQSARSNYYLRKSLSSEIADNLVVIEAYMKGLESGSASSRQAPINIDTFVWECLKNSGNTLETPSELLRESRKFYRDIADIHQKIANTTYGPGYGREQMQLLVDNMRKVVLPAFEKNLAGLQKHLKDSGITVE